MPPIIQEPKTSYNEQRSYQMPPTPQEKALMLANPPSQQQLMAQQNPFSMEQYKMVGMPDVPLQYGSSFTDSILNDNEVPEEVKKKNWWAFHKDNTLTFLDEPRKQSKLLNFDIIKIDILNNTPYYEYTFEKELEFSVLRNVFETKLDRALGFKTANVKNERIVLQSQFTEQRQISENDNRQIREGFFKRLLGRR